MERTRSISAIFLMMFIVTVVHAEPGTGHIRYVPVAFDENLLEGPADKSVTADIYVVDGDETKGRVMLYFADPGEPGRVPKEAYLIVNIPDMEWAESTVGFSVYKGETKIGSVANVNRNSRVQVALDAKALGAVDGLKLSLRCNGTDGLYTYARHSRFGAVLMLYY